MSTISEKLPTGADSDFSLDQVLKMDVTSFSCRVEAGLIRSPEMRRTEGRSRWQMEWQDRTYVLALARFKIRFPTSHACQIPFCGSRRPRSTVLTNLHEELRKWAFVLVEVNHLFGHTVTVLINFFSCLHIKLIGCSFCESSRG
jgi:hypothetical protein